MKKTISILIIIAVVLCCCSCTSTSVKVEVALPTATPSATAEMPTPTPTPETFPGKVRVLSFLIPYITLDRGECINVIGEDETYYYIELDGVNGIIPKYLIRMFYESIPDEKTAYAKNGAALFRDYSLSGELVDSPLVNTEIIVVDEFNGIAIVRYGEFEGYMSSDYLSDTEVDTWSSYGNSYSGNGGSSGGGAPAPAPAIDGGDIALAFHGFPDISFDKMFVPLLYVTDGSDNEDSNFRPGNGTVFADATPVYACMLRYGDDVSIVSIENDTATLMIDNLLLCVPARCVRANSESPYEVWNGYAKGGTKLCSDENLTQIEKTLNVNDIVNVVEEFDGYYIVQIEDGYYYTEIDNISDNKFETWSAGNYSAGSGGGAAPASGGEWTEPVM